MHALDEATHFRNDSIKIQIILDPTKLYGKIAIKVTEVVVDSSIIVALTMPEERSDWALEKISAYNYHHIPEFAYYEVANVVKYKTHLVNLL